MAHSVEVLEPDLVKIRQEAYLEGARDALRCYIMSDKLVSLISKDLLKQKENQTRKNNSLALDPS